MFSSTSRTAKITIRHVKKSVNLCILYSQKVQKIIVEIIELLNFNNDANEATVLS